ncbi:hypothetical protein RND81_13G168300 [Saponaria officinalis]|uniref:Uncharacterized protein n=1 Tax=Saponaria officinalis TaxID=3572 RepID=A0AAW1H459_SAPOF
MDAAHLNNVQFSKLDDLLTQTQLYSEFLLEKMDDITNGVEEEQEEPVKEKKKGRGRKRKAQYNDKKAKRAVAAMLTRSKEGTAVEGPYRGGKTRKGASRTCTPLD